MLSSIMALVIAALISTAQPQAIRQHVNLSVLQTECLTEAIYFESRSEGVIGGSAVSYVIQNRAMIEHKSYCQIIHEKSQFSFYKPNHNPVINEPSAWKNSAEIAVDTQLNRLRNPIGNATYYNTTPFRGFRNVVFIGKVGHHLFYGSRSIIYSQPLINNLTITNNWNVPEKSYQENQNTGIVYDPEEYTCSPGCHDANILQGEYKDGVLALLKINRVNYESTLLKHRYKKITHRKKLKLSHVKFQVKKPHR